MSSEGDGSRSDVGSSGWVTSLSPNVSNMILTMLAWTLRLQRTSREIHSGKRDLMKAYLFMVLITSANEMLEVMVRPCTTTGDWPSEPSQQSISTHRQPWVSAVM